MSSGRQYSKVWWAAITAVSIASAVIITITA